MRAGASRDGRFPPVCTPALVPTAKSGAETPLHVPGTAHPTKKSTLSPSHFRKHRRYHHHHHQQQQQQHQQRSKLQVVIQICVCMKRTFLHIDQLFSSGRSFFSLSRSRGTQGGRVYSRRKFGPRPGSLARALGVQSCSIWHTFARSLSAEP